MNGWEQFCSVSHKWRPIKYSIGVLRRTRRFFYCSWGVHKENDPSSLSWQQQEDSFLHREFCMKREMILQLYIMLLQHYYRVSNNRTVSINVNINNGKLPFIKLAKKGNLMLLNWWRTTNSRLKKLLNVGLKRLKEI